MREEISAGGIVFKKTKKGVLWLIVQHSHHKGWIFPKGLTTDHSGENFEKTAVREVKEEGGIEAKIIAKIETPLTYWYVFKGEKIKKTAWFFLMEYVSGSEKDHDFEVQDAKWLTTDEVKETLTYPSDKKVFEEAVRVFKELKQN